MIRNKKLQEELELLARAGEFQLIAKWFTYWDNLNDRIDKFFLFCHFFFPDYFRNTSPVIHRYLIKKYFSEKNEYHAAPRGFSKTTLLQFGILFDCICKSEQFIVVIEKTFAEAAEVIQTIRDECAENRLLIECYGNLLKNKATEKLLKGVEYKDKDAKGDVIINGVRIRGKGFDQPIRGLKSGAFRPTKIVLDDIEQDRFIHNPEQRKKYRDNYNKGVQPAIDTEGTIKLFGTILHEDSLLNNLIELHNGRVFRAYYIEGDPEFETCNRYTEDIFIDGQHIKLLWASRWSWELLMKKKKDMQDKNESSAAFEQEYRNNPIAEEERKFKYEWLWNDERRIRLSDLKKKGLSLRGFAAIDCADSKKDGSDWTATVVIFIDNQNNWYRVDVRNERRNIKELNDLIFETWNTWSRFGLEKIGVEKKAFQDQVEPLLRDEKKKRNSYPIVEELKPMGRSKEGRILGALQGRYEYGKIWTVLDDNDKPVGDTEILFNQLYNFPNATNDDLSDAEAYISDMASPPPEDRERTHHHTNPIDDPYSDVKPSEGYHKELFAEDREHHVKGNPSPFDDDPY